MTLSVNIETYNKCTSNTEKMIDPQNVNSGIEVWRATLIFTAMRMLLNGTINWDLASLHIILQCNCWCKISQASPTLQFILNFWNCGVVCKQHAVVERKTCVDFLYIPACSPPHQITLKTKRNNTHRKAQQESSLPDIFKRQQWPRHLSN